MAKRTATSSLNRDNWDAEEESEEMGSYQTASPNELKIRPIKRAKRRGIAGGGGEGPSVFKNFKAFGASDSDTTTPTFSFLSGSGDKPKLVSLKNFPSFSFNKPSDTSKADDEKKSIPSFGTTPFSTSTSAVVSSNENATNTGVNNDKASSKPAFKFGIDSKKVSETPPGSVISSFNFNPTKSNSAESSTFKFGVNSSDDKTNASEKQKFNFGMQSSSKSSENALSKTEIPTSENTKNEKVNGVQSESEKSKLFLANLKALNYGVLNWVKKHIEKNQYINLTPIFEDYKKHFEDIKKNHDTSTKKCSKEGETVKVSEKPAAKKSELPAKSSNSTDSESKKTSESSTPLFSFGASSNSLSKPGSFAFGSADTTKNDENKPLESSKSPEVKPFTFGINNSSFKSSVTGNPEATQKTPSFTFGGKEKSTFSFGSSDNKPCFSFGGSDSNKKPEFSFGSKEKTSDFSFGKSEDSSSKVGLSFTPASSETNDNLKSETKSKETEEEESDEVPKVEINEVKEDDAVYEKKVKLFYKKDDKYVDKGVGTLFLKPAGGEKTQLVVRALTNLGNILLNIILNESIPTQRVGKNNVLLVCVPNPPIDPKSSDIPVSMLVRVKTESDADELLEKINEHKK